MKTKLKITLTLISLGIIVTACSGGGTNTTGGNSQGNPSTISNTVRIPSSEQVRTPASAYLEFSDLNNSSSQSIKIKATTLDNSQNGCFKIQQINGKNFATSYTSGQYYSPVQITFSIKNTCASPTPMVNLPVILSNVQINGQAPTIGWISQTGNPYLDNITQKVNNKDIEVGLNTPACEGAYCSWAKVAADAIKTFTINASVNGTINSFTIDDIKLNTGSLPPPPTTSPGTIQLNVVVSDTLKALCKQSTSSCNIKVNLNSPTGSLVKSPTIINNGDTSLYHTTYSNLAVGIYTIAVDTSSYPNLNGGSITLKFTPSENLSVSSNTETSGEVVLTYVAAVKPKGNLTVTANDSGLSIIDKSTFKNIGSLAGTVTSVSNIAENYMFNLNLNGSYTLMALTPGKYSINLQGIADPLTGAYYSVTPKIESVVDGSTKTTSLNYASVTSAKHNVTFNVTGAPSGQKVAFADNTAAFKYNSDTLQTGTYQFLNIESAVAITINAPSGYTVDYLPKVITPTVNSVTVTFNSSVTPPTPPSGKGRMIGYVMGWNSRYGGLPPAQELIDAGYTHLIVAMGVFKNNPAGAIYPVFDNINKPYIDALHAGGIKVLLALGGASTDRESTSVDYEALRAQVGSDQFKTNFISSLASIIKDYGFDGVDFDVEHGIEKQVSLDSMADIINTLHKDYPNLLISLAPQVANISPQPGFVLGQGGIWGSYTYVIDKTYSSLTWVGVQAYNSGSIWGIDGSLNPYDPNADPVDFSVAIAGDLLESWPTKFYDGRTTGFPTYISHLRPDQVVLGYLAPSSDGSIDGGGPAANTLNIKKALACLNSGACPGSRYLKPKAYGLMGGVFNWEVSYDKNNNYKFAKDLKACAISGVCN